MSDVILFRGAAIDRAAICVVNLHGRALGAPAAEALAERLALPDVAHVIPEADDRSWYPESFLAAREANQPRLDAAMARLAAIVDELRGRGFAPSRIVLLGFSQGACLALEYLYRARGAFAGVVAFTGGLIGPPATTWPAIGGIEGMPVLMCTSDVDAWVPLWRVRESAAALAACGAEVDLQVLAGRDHLVDEREIAAARVLLAVIAARAGRDVRDTLAV
jgi:predicted esterase